MNYWLVKTDPKTYSWEDLLKEKSTPWDGVRNYQARNNLKKMKKNDKVLFYHSQTTKDVVAIAKVTKEYFQDPTTDDNRWVAVELQPLKSFSNPVTLLQIKNQDSLKNIALIKQSRLSVMPITKNEFETIVKLGK